MVEENQGKVEVEIELVPWWHMANSPTNIKTVKYIQKLPKNATVLVEMDPKLKEYLSKASSAISIHGLQAIKGEPTPAFWAGLEAMHEFNQRAIYLIPLETSEENQLLLDNMNRAMQKGAVAGSIVSNMTFDQFKEILDLNIHREERIANRIKDKAEGFKGKKLYVFIGNDHVPNLAKLLKEKDIPVKVNTDIFGQFKNFVEQDMELESKIREATLSGKRSESARLSQHKLIIRSQIYSNRVWTQAKARTILKLQISRLKKIELSQRKARKRRTQLRQRPVLKK